MTILMWQLSNDIIKLDYSKFVNCWMTSAKKKNHKKWKIRLSPTQHSFRYSCVRSQLWIDDVSHMPNAFLSFCRIVFLCCLPCTPYIYVIVLLWAALRCSDCRNMYKCKLQLLFVLEELCNADWKRVVYNVCDVMCFVAGLHCQSDFSRPLVPKRTYTTYMACIRWKTYHYNYVTQRRVRAANQRNIYYDYEASDMFFLCTRTNNANRLRSIL